MSVRPGCASSASSTANSLGASSTGAPRHATPSSDAERWIYWKNRFDRMAVVFRDGRVAGIEETSVRALAKLEQMLPTRCR